jgi:hypothetical protein
MAAIGVMLIREGRWWERTPVPAFREIVHVGSVTVDESLETGRIYAEEGAFHHVERASESDGYGIPYGLGMWKAREATPYIMARRGRW